MNKQKSGEKMAVNIARGDIYEANCPTRGVLDHVTSRWSTLILVMLLQKSHRFSELARRIGGVSDRMLAHSLKALETDGFVLRIVHSTKPPTVEYKLTPFGSEVAQRVESLTNWVEANVEQVIENRKRFTSL